MNQAGNDKPEDDAGTSCPIKKPPPLHGLVRMVRQVVAGVGGACLAALMFLVAADVAGRYLFNHPIPGGYELVEYLMAIVVPLGVAYCAEQKAHVGVDLVVERLSARARNMVDACTQLVTVVAAVAMAWQIWLSVPGSYASGLKSAVLHIPTYPFVVAVAVGSVAFVLFALAHFIELMAEIFSP